MHNSEQVDHLRKYFKARIKSLHLLLEKNLQGVEAIHDARVDIKKIRAVCALVAFCDNTFDETKHLEPFIDLFKPAGKLRDLQHELMVVKKNIKKGHQDAHVAGLDVLILQAQADVHQIIEKGIAGRIEEEEKKILTHIEGLKDKDITAYLDETWEKTSDRVRKKIFRERELHVVRKGLKDFLYSLKSVSSKRSAALNERLRVWDRMLVLLGDWHECQTVFDDLTRIFYGSSVRSDNTLKKIRLKLMIEKEKIFERILNAYRIERRALSENPFTFIH